MAQQKTIELEVKTDKAIAEIEAVRDCCRKPLLMVMRKPRKV